MKEGTPTTGRHRRRAISDSAQTELVQGSTVRTEPRDDTVTDTAHTKPRPRPNLETALTEIQMVPDADTNPELNLPSPNLPSPNLPSPSPRFTPSETRLTEESGLFAGAMIGDYRIERKIAEGGWGSVYSAIHPVIGRRAAIKILKKRLCQEPAFVRRFIDEARAVTQIGHPNIVDVYTFGETPDGRSYFVMEWLKGETLWDRLRRGPLKLAELRAIATPLAHALEAAHEKSIIHRDLKPENVFLVETRHGWPRVKLLDFGLAKLATNDPRPERTSTGEIVGTPMYMAPEQARGMRIDHRVDIYAFGGILFAALTGRTPYSGDNSADLITAALTKPVPRPSTFASNVPARLDDLVVAMLAKRAEDRPSLANVHAVLAELVVEPKQQQTPATRQSRGVARAVQLWRSMRQLLRSMGEASASASRAMRAATHSIGERRSRTGLAIAGASAIVLVVLVTVILSANRSSSRSERAPVGDTGGVILAVSGASAFTVLIDDQPTVPEPDGKIPLAPGMHTVEVTAPGMQPESFRVAITAGQVLREPVELQRARMP